MPQLLLSSPLLSSHQSSQSHIAISNVSLNLVFVCCLLPLYHICSYLSSYTYSSHISVSRKTAVALHLVMYQFVWTGNSSFTHPHFPPTTLPHLSSSLTCLILCVCFFGFSLPVLCCSVFCVAVVYLFPFSLTFQINVSFHLSGFVKNVCGSKCILKIYPEPWKCYLDLLFIHS